MGKLSQLVENLKPRKKQEQADRPKRKETTISYKNVDTAMTKQQKKEICKRLLESAKKSQGNRERVSQRRLEEKISDVTVKVEEIIYADLDLSTSSKGTRVHPRKSEVIYAEIKGTSAFTKTEPIYENLKDQSRQSLDNLYERVFPWMTSGIAQTKASLEQQKIGIGHER